VLLDAGQAAEAADHFRECLRISDAQDMHVESMTFLPLNGLGRALATTDWSRAEPMLTESEPWLLGEHRIIHHRLRALRRTADLFAARGDTGRAARYAGRAAALGGAARTSGAEAEVVSTASQ
jgi:hypothetical protein